MGRRRILTGLPSHSCLLFCFIGAFGFTYIITLQVDYSYTIIINFNLCLKKLHGKIAPDIGTYLPMLLF